MSDEPFLVDFLAAKKMNLVCAVHSELNIPPDLCNLIDCEYKLTGPAGVTKNSENTIINFSVSLTGGVEFQSWFIGKKIVPYKNFGEFKSSFDSQYADFIVGYDANNCEEINPSLIFNCPFLLLSSTLHFSFAALCTTNFSRF